MCDSDSDLSAVTKGIYGGVSVLLIAASGLMAGQWRLPAPRPHGVALTPLRPACPQQPRVSLPAAASRPQGVRAPCSARCLVCAARDGATLGPAGAPQQRMRAAPSRPEVGPQGCASPTQAALPMPPAGLTLGYLSLDKLDLEVCMGCTSLPCCHLAARLPPQPSAASRRRSRRQPGPG